jgi:hypothetical protein
MNTHQAETNKIINFMKKYIQTYIEKPNAIFGNMPICPFAKKARLDNKICYVVYAFEPCGNLSQYSDLLDLIRKFRKNQAYEILLVTHPDQQAFSLEEMNSFMQDLNTLIHPLGLVALSGHPLDEFNIKGVFTRGDPFINFIVQSRKVLESASESLKPTAYYDSWTLENLNSIRQLYDHS